MGQQDLFEASSSEISSPCVECDTLLSFTKNIHNALNKIIISENNHLSKEKLKFNILYATAQKDFQRSQKNCSGKDIDENQIKDNLNQNFSIHFKGPSRTLTEKEVKALQYKQGEKTTIFYNATYGKTPMIIKVEIDESGKLEVTYYDQHKKQSNTQVQNGLMAGAMNPLQQSKGGAPVREDHRNKFETMGIDDFQNDNAYQRTKDSLEVDFKKDHEPKEKPKPQYIAAALDSEEMRIGAEVNGSPNNSKIHFQNREQLGEGQIITGYNQSTNFDQKHQRTYQEYQMQTSGKGEIRIKNSYDKTNTPQSTNRKRVNQLSYTDSDMSLSYNKETKRVRQFRNEEVMDTQESQIQIGETKLSHRSNQLRLHNGSQQRHQQSSQVTSLETNIADTKIKMMAKENSNERFGEKRKSTFHSVQIGRDQVTTFDGNNQQGLQEKSSTATIHFGESTSEINPNTRPQRTYYQGSETSYGAKVFHKKGSLEHNNPERKRKIATTSVVLAHRSEHGEVKAQYDDKLEDRIHTKAVKATRDTEGSMTYLEQSQTNSRDGEELLRKQAASYYDKDNRFEVHYKDQRRGEFRQTQYGVKKEFDGNLSIAYQELHIDKQKTKKISVEKRLEGDIVIRYQQVKSPRTQEQSYSVEQALDDSTFIKTYAKTKDGELANAGVGMAGKISEDTYLTSGVRYDQEKGVKTTVTAQHYLDKRTRLIAAVEKDREIAKYYAGIAKTSEECELSVIAGSDDGDFFTKARAKCDFE